MDVKLHAVAIVDLFRLSFEMLSEPFLLFLDSKYKHDKHQKYSCRLRFPIVLGVSPTMEF